MCSRRMSISVPNNDKTSPTLFTSQSDSFSVQEVLGGSRRFSEVIMILCKQCILRLNVGYIRDVQLKYNTRLLIAELKCGGSFAS